MSKPAIRPCERCLGYFVVKRPHQRFCGDKCRREAWTEKRANSSEPPGERVSEVTRRESRDGKGTKVYLQADEIEVVRWLLRYGTGHQSGPVVGRLKRKMLQAAGRTVR